MKQVNDTTFRKEAKSDARDRIETIIGDDKQEDFKPQVKVQGWDNESNFSLRLKETGFPPRIVEGEAQFSSKSSPQKKVVAENGEGLRTEIYETGESKRLPENGIELELVLKSKPSSNEFRFSIESKDTELFYQPSLKEEDFPEAETVTDTEALDSEGDRIAHRPEHIVGSYTVYRKEDKANIEGGKKYRTGKIGHIHRPRIADDSGNEAWGELDYRNGELVLTIPQSFLDKAVYPVRVDPTFGYDVEGGSTVRIGAGSRGSPQYYRKAVSFNLGESANVSKITASLSSGVDVTDIPTKYGIYREDGGGTDSHSLIATNTKNYDYTSTKTWVDISFSQTLSSDNYMLIPAADGTGTGNNFYVSYDDVGSRRYYVEDYPGTFSFDDPWNISETGTGRKYSIYATYTASNTAPDAPSNPSPSDGATGVSTDPTLSVDVSDPDGDSMDVTFDVDTNDDGTFDTSKTDTGVADGGTATVNISNLAEDQKVDWKATADDGSATTTSSTWSFTTTVGPGSVVETTTAGVRVTDAAAVVKTDP